MSPDRCYELIKAVDITPILAVLPELRFVAVNIGSKNPGKSPCLVTLPSPPLPAIVKETVDGLGLGGQTRRLLFRKLGPRQGMAPHTDDYLASEATWRRFQLPITSHPDIRMRWPDDNEEVHLMPGFLYEVRVDRLHEIVHNADVDRVHLQIDQVGAEI